MPAEKNLETRIIAAAALRGWFCRHFDAPGLDGWPDLLCLKGDQARLVEVKAGTALGKAQRAFHSYLKEMYETPVYVLERKGGVYIVSGGYQLKEPVVCATISEALDIIL